MFTEFYIQSTDSLQVEEVQVNVKNMWSQRAHFWYREAEPKGIVQAPNGTVSVLYKRPSENPVVQRDQMGHASFYIYGSQLCCCCFLFGLSAEWHDNSCLYPTNCLRRGGRGGGQQGQFAPGRGKLATGQFAPGPQCKEAPSVRRPPV